MFKLFLDNLELIIFLLTILGVSVLSNIIMGIQLNVNELGMNFNLKKLVSGLVRALMISIVLILLTGIISFLPGILESSGITLVNNEFADSISIFTIIAILVSAILKYFKDTLSKLKKLFTLTEEDLANIKYIQTNNIDKINNDDELYDIDSKQTMNDNSENKTYKNINMLTQESQISEEYSNNQSENELKGKEE